MLGWVDQLILEYTVGQLELTKRADRLNRKNPFDKDDLRQINKAWLSLSNGWRLNESQEHIAE